MRDFPPLAPPINAALRERVCNTKIVVAESTKLLSITSYDNNKQGVIIQNQDATNAVYVTFSEGSKAGPTLRIVPGGSLALDFAISDTLYCFTQSGTANCVVLEISGYDTYQLLQLKLLERLVNIAERGLALLARGR